MDEEVRLEDLLGGTVESTGFWVATPCSSERCMFRRNVSAPSSGSKSKPRRNPAEATLSLPPDTANYLHGLFYDPEDRGGMFLRNVVLRPNYAPFQPRRRCSSVQRFVRESRGTAELAPRDHTLPAPEPSVRRSHSQCRCRRIVGSRHRAVLARPVRTPPPRRCLCVPHT
jgi:hypothetical protein